MRHHCGVPNADHARRRRPFALLILAALLVFKAGLAVMVLVGVNIDGGRLLPGLVQIDPATIVILGTSTVIQTLLAVLAVLLVTAAVGLIGLQRRGWVLAMVLTGVFVAADLWSYTQGNANHLWMLLNLVTVFYLNQEDVRRVVGVNDEPLLPGGLA